jgi:hypothetical protein
MWPGRRRRHCRGRGNDSPHRLPPRPRGPFDPQQIATAPTGDDFVAPPLPEGMSVLGANVVAFALSTAARRWVNGSIPASRSASAAARCAVRDFRTTDLAQDWFLTNDGPERDRAGLDPDGDGFACNWTPERYREEARAARPWQTFGTLQDG